MTGKVTGVSLPTNLTDGDTVTETWVDAVYTTETALDSALAMDETVKVSTTKAEYSNTGAETTLVTYTVSANTLGTGNVVKAEMIGYFYNNSGGPISFTVKTYLGSTSLSDTISISTSASKYLCRINSSVMADGATSAQVATQISEVQGSEIFAYDDTFAQDTTGSLTFKITVTAPSASANIGFAHFWSQVKLIDAT